MQLKLFKTLWGFTEDVEVAIRQAIQADFQGLEGAVPANSGLVKRWKSQLGDAGLDFIAEITTAGSYVPDRNAGLQEHLDSLESKLEYSLMVDPLFITCLGGCDAWPEAKNVEFFSRAMELANAANCIISFETHRGRALFNPWITERIVAQLPEIKLCERLMDTELEVLHRLAPNAWHIHARIGYDQGPQVPHPAAPEYQNALRSHQGWWELIWRQQILKHWSVTTMTPEFGPDGYLHESPFSREPVADLWEVNQWMAQEERRHFAAFLQS